jgi:hypothetical protein
MKNTKLILVALPTLSSNVSIIKYYVMVIYKLNHLKRSEVNLSGVGRLGQSHAETDACELIINESELDKIERRIRDVIWKDENAVDALRWSVSGERYVNDKFIFETPMVLRSRNTNKSYDYKHQCRVTDDEYKRLQQTPVPKQFVLTDNEKAQELTVAMAKALREVKQAQRTVRIAEENIKNEQKKFQEAQQMLQKAQGRLDEVTRNEAMGQQPEPVSQVQTSPKFVGKPALQPPNYQAPLPPPKLKGGSDDGYYQKYLKYKRKYLQLNNQTRP